MSKSVNSVVSANRISNSEGTAPAPGVLSYPEVRDSLVIRLINYAHNIDQLDDIPYVLLENLAAVFYYSQKSRGKAAGKARLITSEDLALWGVDPYTLYRDALVSSMNLSPAVLAPMQDLLGLPVEEAEDSFPMYVLSSKRAQYGAAAALYPQVLANIAEGFHDNLYLIPSSVHEWIILRASTISDPEPIKGMIREINRTEVLPGEVLSDDLYYYDAEKDEFSRFDSGSRK